MAPRYQAIPCWQRRRASRSRSTTSTWRPPQATAGSSGLISSTKRASATACLETNRTQESAFTFSSVGITSSSQNDDLPIINISGSFNLASSPVGRRTQQTFIIDDSLTWVRGRHSLQMGGGFTRAMRDFSGFRQPGQLVFQTFPDFLLGLNAAQNGTNLFSNIVTSVDLTGLFDRESQELGNVRVLPGHLPGLAATDPQPGSAMGVPAAAHRRARTSDDGRSGSARSQSARDRLSCRHRGCREIFPVACPPGVTETDTESVIDQADSNTWGPRLGATWRVLGDSDRVVVRGGYGVYYSRTTGQVQTQTTTTQPFGLLRISAGPPNGAADFCESVSRADPLRIFLPAVRALHAVIEPDRKRRRSGFRPGAHSAVQRSACRCR